MSESPIPPSVASAVSPALGRRRFIAGGVAAVGAWALAPAAPVSAETPGARPPALRAPDVITGWVRTVYLQVKRDRILPPAAARVYAYVALAGYEAVVSGMPRHRSLGGQLNDFAAPPTASGIDWEIAANESIAAVAAAMFADRSSDSREALEAHRAEVGAAHARRVAPGLLARSVRHGQAVGAHIVARSTRDGYADTRGLPFTPPVGPDKWIRTPPNFGASIEPYWGSTRSFALATNDECRPRRPVPYSESAGSPFWQQAKVVVDTAADLDDARRATALFWRDNPDGSTGLPAGHWMLTTCNVCEQLGLGLDRSAEVIVLTALAVADGFTSCWTEKYESNLLRPVSYIQRVIDPGWNSFVNSPAFPEYTSGHSVGSGAAAEVLTTLLGNVSHVDDVGLQNGFPSRSFRSFWEAADEAAISRLYGGIHYPMGISAGLEQGVAVAHKVLARARTRR